MTGLRYLVKLHPDCGLDASFAMLREALQYAEMLVDSCTVIEIIDHSENGCVMWRSAPPLAMRS